MTTQVVTDEQLGQLAKRQADLFARVRNGGVNFERTMKALQAAAEGQCFGYFPSQVYAQKLIPSGATIRKDVDPSNVKVGELEFVKTYEPGVDSPIFGEPLLTKAVDLGANLGLSDLKEVYDRQWEIRAEGINRHGMLIVFPGTLIANSHGRLEIAGLRYSEHDSKWYIDWYGLEELQRAAYRLARIKRKVVPARQVERSYEARK